MNKKILLTLIFVATALQFSFTTSENASVKWGPELEGSKKGTISNLLGHDDTGFYLLGNEKSTIVIRKITTGMNDAGVYEFVEKDKEMDMKFVFETAKYFNRNLYVFKSYLDKDNDKKVLYVQKINKKTMKAEGKTTKLSEIDYEKKNNSGGYNIIASHDERKLMIVNILPFDKEANEKNAVLMCDTNLKVIWKKTLMIPYLDKLFAVQAWKCDDAGDAYCLGRFYKDKVKEVVRGKQNYSYHLLAYTKNGEQKIDYEITLKDKFISDISFAINDDGTIVCGGFYSKIGRNAVDGTFYQTLDAETKSVKVSSVKEFELSFLTQGLTEKQEKKAEKKEAKGKDQELFNFDLRDLVRREDGGTVLIGEQYSTHTYCYTNANGGTYCNTYYFYNDVIIVNIDPKGKIEWAEKIPKRQASTNDGGYYSSYALAVTSNKLRFIFNDNKENLALKKQGDWQNFSLKDKNGIVTIVTVGMDGSVVREALFSDADLEVAIRPKVCDQVNDKQLLLFGEKKKTDQFGLVNFN